MSLIRNNPCLLTKYIAFTDITDSVVRLRAERRKMGELIMGWMGTDP